MGTYNIIGGDQKEYGPVSGEDLRRWIAEGRLEARSLARAEGSAEWKPLGTFPEFADILARASAPQASPQVAPPFDTAGWTATVLARPAHVPVGLCLAQSWKLLTANFGLLFGASILVWLAAVVCPFVPIIGPIAYWVFKGVLYGGLYLVFLARIRGQPASVGDVFAGFRIALGQLILTGVLTTLLTQIGFVCCLFLPGIYLFVAWIFSVPLVADKRLEFWSAMELSRKVVTRVWFEVLGLVLLAFLPVLLASAFLMLKILPTLFSFFQDIVAGGHPPDFTRAMELGMHLTKTSFLFGMLRNLVFLLNLPFAAGALMYAYENLFGARPTSPP